LGILSPMSTPIAETFFDLTHFPHKSLWKNGEPVWSALAGLKKYLEQASLGAIEIQISQNVFLHNRDQISIGKGTILEPGVMIEGPCIIGRDCVLRHDACLRGGVILGDRCVIGHSSEVKGSIFLHGAAAPHLAYVGDSVIGNEVNLGAGVKCANLRLDRTEITILWEGKKLKTGMRKLGAIIGDRAQVGCNCVLSPGTLIGQGTVCHPLLHLAGFLPAQSVVRGSVGIEIESNPERILKQLGALP
jgi:NDP-sugar pyrophosphorylase family protein